jgi:hypothetical protein
MGWGNVGVAMPGPATVNVGIGHPRSTTVVARADARQRDFASRPRHPAAPEGTRQCAPLKDCQIERHRNRRYVCSAFGAVLFSVALTFVLSSVAHAQDAASAAPAPGPTVPATGSPVPADDARVRGVASPNSDSLTATHAVPIRAPTPAAESAVPRTGSTDPGDSSMLPSASAVRTPPGMATATEEAGAVPADRLPDALSPSSMFLDADVVVKSVMIGLLLASMATWTVWLAKTIELARAKRQARTARRILLSAQLGSSGSGDERPVHPRRPACCGRGERFRSRPSAAPRE